MDPKLKGILKALSLSLRHILEGYYDRDDAWHPGDLERRLNELGVWRDRDPKPVDELPFLSSEDKRAREVVDAYLSYRREAGVSRSEAVAEFVRESSYTWANRLLTLRFMESRGIIDEVILQKEVYGWRSLQHHRLVQRHPEQTSGDDEGLYNVLFNEFTERAQDLPELFSPNSPSVALKPSVAALKRCISFLSGREHVDGGECTSDAVFEASDALGWAYQYWNAEEKDRVFERVRTKKAKIEGSDIIPATQIYTEPYMVKFLVQNSLGAQWMCMHPESRLPERWEYYVRDADRSPVNLKPVKEITFMDPACGSGHFLLEAFDLFFEMYLEEGTISQPEEICTSILNNNLFGLDIDGRAVQIAQASLWMKAKTRTPRLQSNTLLEFHGHLVAENIRLPRGRDHLEEFLRRYPEDQPLKPALEAVLEGLANVDELGSLVQIEEPVERELLRLRGEYGYQTTLTGPKSREELDAWGRGTLLRVRDHFSREAVGADLIASFFGSYAIKGLEIFNLLSRKYDIVATNPPYLGSGNMGTSLKEFIKKYYPEGSHDVYAAFILSNLSLTKKNGLLSMVSQQSWMFLKYYSDMRKKLLDTINIEIISQLGTGAFNEISGEVVNVALFIIRNIRIKDNYLLAIQLVGTKNAEDKDNLLKHIIHKNQKIIFKVKQDNFLYIPETPLCYWLNETFFKLLKGKTIKDESNIVAGLQTSNDKRFVRFNWESKISCWEDVKNKRWVSFEKGGGYGKWYGLQYWTVDWQYNGARIIATPSPRVQNTQYYFKSGYVYSGIASGCLGLRKLEEDSIFSARATSGVFPKKKDNAILSILNCRFASVITRAIAQNLQMFEGAVLRVPYPSYIIPELNELEKKCIELKQQIVSVDPLERTFNYKSIMNVNNLFFNNLKTNVLLHTIEGYLENTIFKLYNLEDADINFIMNEAGVPITTYSFINGYPTHLDIDDDSYLSINKIYDKHPRVILSSNELSDIKNKLRSYYEAGFGSRTDFDEVSIDDNEDNDHIGAFIPIPAETFIEELSQKLEIHPISVYWMLREGIENEGWRCVPEEQRITKDRLTVIILRLLGHRWPRQIAVGEPVPEWADPDGVIPITRGFDQPTLFERVRERVAIDLGMNHAQFEREFNDIMGISLEDWVKRDFFKHHVSQFKKRPVAWQLESKILTESGKGRGRRKTSIRDPAFSCLLYYHKLDSDILRKVQTQYVGPLKGRYETELRTLEGVGNPSPDQSERIITLRDIVEELKYLDSRLESVIIGGFDCSKLKEICSDEPLDKWTSADGIRPPPKTPELFHLQEREYKPDINDGVRVNIAPLQKAGLLSSDVLANKDLDQAITDRAEWRVDERRWCRDGKLPQPGWWRKT
jgi:hypothetical protein